MTLSSPTVPTLVIAGAHPKLYNRDLAPTAPAARSWGVFSLFAMWMSDVHSVGGYTFAASLFLLGLTGWQVLTSMLVASWSSMSGDLPEHGIASWRGMKSGTQAVRHGGMAILAVLEPFLPWRGPTGGRRGSRE